MKKRNHLIIAIVIFVVIIIKPTIGNISAFVNNVLSNKLDISSIVPSPTNPELLLASMALLGGFFPDIDFIKLLRKWHRKLLHNIFAVILATFASSIIGGLLVAEAFFLGCTSHILVDSLTVTGTYLLWPISKKFKIHWKVSTGTWEDDAAMLVIVSLIVGAYIALMYFSF